MSAVDDFKLISHGIGFTNIVSRPTKGSADLSRKEIREGAEILLSKLRKYQPKIAVFNGKMIYEVFSGKKNFDFGRQPDPI
ncbi:G/T mismatch-specific thymine DNA glycosylase, partial [Stegodyphus mimosarum]